MVSAEFPLRQHPQWMKGPARIEDDEIVLETEAAETYVLSESEHRERLLMDLAALRDCETRDVVRFVGRHGLLWHGPKDIGGECRESLIEWRGAVRHLWVTVGLYLTLDLAEEVGEARPVRKYLQDLRGLGFFHARISDNDRECKETASVVLAERITGGMEGCSWTLVAACTLSREGIKEGGPMDFLFGEDPPSLVSAAYAQFASLIVNRVPFSECEGCGVLFIPEHGSQRYCSKRCSNRARKAKQRAREA